MLVEKNRKLDRGSDMKRNSPPGNRTLVRLSSTLAARMVHDADAAGEPVEITSPATLRALRRGFLRLLADTRRFHTMQVSDVVAAGLRDPTDEPVEEGQSYNLALGFDRFGRGVFLLRPVLCGGTEPASGTLSRDQAQIVKELRLSMRSLHAQPDEAP